MKAHKIRYGKYLHLFLSVIWLSFVSTQDCKVNGPVQDLFVDRIGQRSFQVSWRAPEGVVECVLEYSICVHVTGMEEEFCETQNPYRTSWSSTKGVLPCTNYTVIVAAIDSNSNRSDNASVTLQTNGPGPVANLSLTAVDSVSATVAWDAPEENPSCTSLYNLCISENGTDEETCIKQDGSKLNWENISPLQPCTEYRIEVTPIDFNGELTEGSSIMLLTVNVLPNTTEYNVTNLLACTNYDIIVKSLGSSIQESRNTTVTSYTDVQDFPGPVKNLAAVVTYDPIFGVATLGAEWVAPEDLTCIQHFRACNTKLESGEETCVQVDSSVTQLSIGTSIDYCSNYNLVITSLDGNGKSYGEAAVQVATYNLASVSNLSVSSISSNTAQVTWERPADLEACVDNYVVCLKNDVTQEVVCDSQTGSYTQWYSGPTLSACTNYTVQVKAQDYSNNMGGNATLTFFTAPDNVPYMYLVSKSAHSALVSWQASENSLCLHQYTLCWKIRDDSNGDYDCDVTPSTLDEYNVTGLDACTDYAVLIRSVGYNNLTSRDYSIHLKTEFEEPSLMSDIAITSSTAHSMRIQWETITNSSSCVSLYIVCFGDIGSDEQICTSQPTYSWMWSSGDVLAACSTYNVSLRAQYQDQQFYLGNIVHMLGPEEVQNLTLESRTISSLQISWGIPQDNLECVEQQIISWCYNDPYDEYWQTCSPTSNTSVNVNTDISIYNITDLLECSQYFITVTSVTAKGIMAHNVTTKLYTVSHKVKYGFGNQINLCRNRGLNPRPPAQKSDTLPLDHQVVNETEETCTLVKETFTTLEDLAENSQYTVTVSTIGSDGSESPSVHILLNLT
uniref:(California timema) hypothetical protein n=1 Tax=Timema californicum TaxID=61474 RepID=A0A7R9JE70_TIMCA|nr:unnamed protein product [Timema californicum]